MYHGRIRKTNNSCFQKSPGQKNKYTKHPKKESLSKQKHTKQKNVGGGFLLPPCLTKWSPALLPSTLIDKVSGRGQMVTGMRFFQNGGSSWESEGCVVVK